MEVAKEIITEEIRYTVNGQDLLGLLAYDNSKSDKRSGILVIHEWQGINDYAKKRAVDLAEEGDLDPAAPREKQEAFVKEMTESEADFSYIVYGNLPAHNFTNPSGSINFKDEANMAWASMLVFFDSLFEDKSM